MPYQHLSHIKHRLTLSGEEIALLRDRLVPIAPIDYDLHSYAKLRGLYGRFDHYCLTDEIEHTRKKAH